MATPRVPDPKWTCQIVNQRYLLTSTPAFMIRQEQSFTSGS
jgi:hypothetical protein